MPIKTIIAHAAKAAKISKALLLAICMQETGLKNVTVKYDGGSPSIGICQLKLDSVKMIGFKGTEKDLSNVSINIYWAAKYIGYQQNRYGSNFCKITAAYNAGSYRESLVMPGYPKNLKYVRGVQRKIAKEYKDRLSCTSNEIAENK